jgi:DNA-binding NarL/FixJ family response regulator
LPEIPPRPDSSNLRAGYAGKVSLRNCILLVDDSPLVRRTLRKIFERAGWEVCGEAANGREAIEKAEQLQPHVIVLDLAMPEMNGLEAARRLKKMIPGVHLILLTMHGNVIRSDEANSAGISAVFSKTDAITALLDKAQSLVDSA